MSLRSSLEQILRGYASALVGFSGGVDSALLTVMARRVLGRERSAAAIGISPALPELQLHRAKRLADQFDLDLMTVRTDELRDPGYVSNNPERCYFCKRELWTKLVAVAAQRGLAAVLEGTNADDMDEHRPGLAAAREFGIRAPLAEAGFRKEDVRSEARTLGIPIWDAPAAPCLSSRVVYGLSITSTRLRQIEQGEAFLRSIGVVGDLRVRHHGDEARIEAAPSQFPLIRRDREAISSRFTDLGFSTVALDLAGYRRGSLLVQREAEVELLATAR